MSSQTSETSAHIQVLPAQLANQIAAGEVVERPASVVKELIENCLDANATQIEVEIENGGHKRILIRDNGSGIIKSQLQLALSRHATSKLKDISDLERISSMGFRGEALASISSVSRLTLSSKPQSQETAWQAQAEGLDMDVEVSPAAHPNGTSVEVLDLFFNTPARRKFLRAEKTEFQHIELIFRRIAMAHPHIAFSLKHNGKLVHKLSVASLEKRVRAICSNALIDQCAKVVYKQDDIEFTGWSVAIGNGQISTEHQYVFVNHRIVRDKLIMHAIRQAYEGMLPDNTYPAYVLFLSLPAQDMDINVHPAKHEVRFHQARQIHDLIFQAVNQAILRHQQSQEGLAEACDVSFTEPPSMPRHDYIRPLQHKEHSQIGSQSALQGGSRSGNTRYAPRPEVNIAETALAYQDLMTPKDSDAKPVKFVSTQQHIIVQTEKGLKVLGHLPVYLKMLKQQLVDGSTPQPLLMPVSVELGKQDVKDICAPFREMGFVIEHKASRLLLKQVPSGLRSLAWTHVFPLILGQTAPCNSETEALTSIAKHVLSLNALKVSELEYFLSRLPHSEVSYLLSVSAISLSDDVLTSLMSETASHQKSHQSS